MAKAGDEIVNPVTGHRIIFRKTTQDTAGELLQMDWIGRPGWKAGPAHVHSFQEERFEVISGTLGSHVAGVERTHKPSKKVLRAIPTTSGLRLGDKPKCQFMGLCRAVTHRRIHSTLPPPPPKETPAS